MELGSIYARFASRLLDSARILDVGCGSGRDTKYFLSQGYSVQLLSLWRCETGSDRSRSVKQLEGVL